MKKATLFILFLIPLWPWAVHAQQNRMWVPADKDKIYIRLAESGARFDADDLYHPGRPSFNDAVVQFNGGCSGGIISDQGLLITNHHCGYGAIRAHSTLKHNYIRDGFWAKSLDEELPNPGMYVTIVRKVYDVTDQVLQGVTDDMDESLRQSRIDENINRLKDTFRLPSWMDLEVKPFLYGNKYYAFVTETFRDVRLVGAPPSSIGKFGADTDNWMWPRHSGDFALFRIYADKNNRPAEYSEDNVPYRPVKWFKVSLQGVDEGDLVVVYGFPGRTRQYLPSFAVRHITEKVNPLRIAVREKALEIMDRHMRSNDTLKLMYTAHYARVANYWKKWKGENIGIRRARAVEQKEALEKELLSHPDASVAREAEEVLDSLRALYAALEAPDLARALLVEAFYINNDWTRRAFILYAMENEKPDRFEEKRSEYITRIMREFRTTDNRVSEELFRAMWEFYRTRMPREFRDSTLAAMDADSLARKIAAESILADSTKFLRVASLSPEEFQKALKNDSGYALARRLIQSYYGKIFPAYQSAQKGMNALMRRYVAVLEKSNRTRPLVPDANGTLRISFGKVAGYRPRDGMYYEPVTTIDGVVEKYIPGDYEFDLPEEFLKLYAARDFGPYAEDGTLPVNFLATAHTTGGNSGSPVLNADGDLVGVNFDRVWEGTMSDLFYDPRISRNISVDTRYVMFIIDKLGKAVNLVNEIQAVK
ncbi:MAG: S46 family peptidase [Chlorobi bacterium]|nr:S46 family peptidase [Chlorobiota bacterium]